MKVARISALIAAACGSFGAHATNGMNMEGYGPVATAMGGASFAYDNGTAALINNPATLALMAPGSSRLDLAIGGLHPDVSAKFPGASNADSGGNAYYMPAVGYYRKDGKFGWGVGMMAQGGMGTEFGSGSFLSSYTSFSGATRGASGQEARSELGIGRLMFPITLDVADNFNVGGTIDYIWGGLDLRMPMSGQQFGAFASGRSAYGSAGGTMVQGLFGLLDNATYGAPTSCVGDARLGGGCIQDVHYAAFDFSEGGNKMKQQAKTSGWSANLGFVWKATPQLAIGGVYHPKTRLKDMEGDGRLVMQVEIGAPANGPANVANVTQSMSVSGRIKVLNFQWPETYGVGMAYQVNDRFMVAADYKRINWAAVMRAFRMQFVANSGLFAGAVLNAQINQNWDNQDVIQLGGAYKVTDAFTVRAGASFSKNPIPDQFMHPLFPAIEKTHYTVGFGYRVDKTSSFDVSLSHAPKVSATNGLGVTVDHAQTNWQAMYSHRF